MRQSTHKKTILPHIISLAKPKTKLQRDRATIEDIYINNPNNFKHIKDYRQQQQFISLKSNNFISRIDTIDNPDIIFNISDHLRQLEKEQIYKQNIGNELSKSNMMRLPRNSKDGKINNCNILGRSGDSKFNNRIIAEQRYNAINLAKWMDQKLINFRKKSTIAFMDILQYKQTILNYALGNIIQSLSKKCKEEGQILSLIWNNTFNMFEEVFKVLVQSNITKQKQKIQQSKQLNEIFQTNHAFLIEQNQAIKKENAHVFQKMKNVIIWNKRLRKDKKTLNTNNRILQYRNVTYSQALQQTIQMILKSSPQSNLITACKNIIKKLSKQKGRKKHFLKRQIDNQFSIQMKNKILQWIQNNSYLNQQNLQEIKKICSINEDLYEYTKLDDVNQMNKIDIYDFFKLYDYGVQVSPPLTHMAVQSQVKVVKHVEVMTKKISNVQEITQTYYTGHHDYSHIAQQSTQKQILQKTNKFKSKHQKPIKNSPKQKSATKLPSKKHIGTASPKKQQLFLSSQKQNQLNAFYEQKQRQKKKNKHHNSLKTPWLQQQHQKLINTLKHDNMSLHNRQQNIYNISDHILGSQSSNLSISQRTKNHVTSKNLQTFNSLKIRDKSTHDLNDSMLNYGLNHSIGVKVHRKKSLAYIRMDQSCKNVGILKKKKFHQTYKDERDQMNINGKEQFMDQIIRRRSFYCKQRVQFANFKEAEQVTENNRKYLRGSHYSKTVSYIQNSNYLLDNVDKIIKRDPAISNIAKSKTLHTSKHLFSSINASIDQIVRIPPKNKQFVNNSLTILTKYISQLIFDYIKLLKKQKQDIQIDCQKAIYPLNILLIDRMTCKYGLKDIAQKKIKNFLQKILTFANISQQIELYAILLGLTDQQVGSDELLIYLKCLVYFDTKKATKDIISTNSTPVDIDIIRENIHKILQYFFDKQYMSLIELKLQIFFQQNTSQITIQGISILIIKQLISRKKQLTLKYSKVHNLNYMGGNFFINIFKMLKMVNNYQDIINVQNDKRKKDNCKSYKEGIQVLKGMRNRQMIKNNRQKKKDDGSNVFSAMKFDITRIAQILRDLMKRSDIMDEEHGKSITRQRFITAAVLYGLPTIQDLEMLTNFFQQKFQQLKEQQPIYKELISNDTKSIYKLSKKWNYNGKINIGDKLSNIWQLSLIYDNKLEQEVMDVMGRIGAVGLYIENSLINLILI